MKTYERRKGRKPIKKRIRRNYKVKKSYIEITPSKKIQIRKKHIYIKKSWNRKEKKNNKEKRLNRKAKKEKKKIGTEIKKKEKLRTEKIQ